MSDFSIICWHPLLRPPAPGAELPENNDCPLKALSCRNQTTSVIAVVTASKPVAGARLIVGDLASGTATIPSSSTRVRLAGALPTPEAGVVCDPLFDVEQFDINGFAPIHISIYVPKGIPSGKYTAPVSLQVDRATVAATKLELEVADVDLPDPRDFSFFLNVWMNPATVARWNGVTVWSDEHFRLLEPYIRDLAEHGQKTVVLPICYQPWGTQTRDPYPNAIIWKKRGDKYEFDFSIADRYIQLHIDHGIECAIHCYSIVQGPGETDTSVIDYLNLDTGKQEQVITKIGDPEYVSAWKQFLGAFREHLKAKGWLDRTYLAFDEKPGPVMDKLMAFVDQHAEGFKTSLAGNIEGPLVGRLDDLSFARPFNEKGIAIKVPPERAAIGVAQLLDPDQPCAAGGKCTERFITTFYVCCGPEFPNNFTFSPLIESRMMGWFAVQGSYDGFLRWDYNDWPDDPYNHPEWAPFPTGDVNFVYPGDDGPVSSLRWEQLLEGIYDYELAMIASTNIGNSDEMVDYEQAISVACRDVDGRTKSLGDIELARRLLIPIAEKAFHKKTE